MQLMASLFYAKRENISLSLSLSIYASIYLSICLSIPRLIVKCGQSPSLLGK